MIQAVLTDIEGTTSSISFVHEVLFPYAAAQLPAFVNCHSENQDVATQLDQVARITGIGRHDTDALIHQLLEWIASDTKATPLKALQGMVWLHGYKNGDYTAHFYPDAVDALHRWHDQGLGIYVYSSGSVQAQQLFFRYSHNGDLRSLISGWFDTTTGAKQDVDSYRRIQLSLALAPAEIVFLSDVDAELDAAATAGFRTIRLARPQDAPLDDNAPSAHPVVASFDEINLSTLPRTRDSTV